MKVDVSQKELADVRRQFLLFQVQSCKCGLFLSAAKDLWITWVVALGFFVINSHILNYQPTNLSILLTINTLLLPTQEPVSVLLNEAILLVPIFLLSSIDAICRFLFKVRIKTLALFNCIWSISITLHKSMWHWMGLVKVTFRCFILSVGIPLRLRKMWVYLL